VILLQYDNHYDIRLNIEFAMLLQLFHTSTVHKKPSSKGTLKCSLLACGLGVSILP